jgi:RimJ/RimL family protein N-acetyltransferase
VTGSMDRMITPFVLEGRHARLEPLSEDHVPGLAAAAAEDRSSFTYTWVPHGTAEAAEYVRSALAEHARGRALPWAVRRLADGRILGSTRYLDMEVLASFGEPAPAPSDDRPPSVLEIGNTWYAASAQRTFVNTDVKLALLGHAFDVWGVLRVTLKTDARNSASRTAIERIGGRFEGVRRAHMPATDGTVRDSAYFSIVRDEWPAVRAALVDRLAVRRGC